MTTLTNTSGVTTFARSSRYMYDANGNMIQDIGNRLDFEYNILNLLYRVNEGAAVYLYSYDGSKLSSGDKRNNGRDYLGSCIYTNQEGMYRLERVSFPEGFITEDLTAYYFLRDHLGNVRVVLNGNTGAVEEENDYYPFGSSYLNSSLIQLSANRFKYNSKEEQPLIGSNCLDYGARIYNPVLGRWLTVDPLAEKYYGWGGYSYCGNNLVRFFDPDGMFRDDYFAFPHAA